MVLCLRAGFPAAAAELADVTLYFAPAAGGTAEDREFFDANLPGEIRGPYYRVVENGEEADFLVSMSIGEREGPGGRFTLGLMTAGDSSPLLELSWDYARVEEMYGWGVGNILAPQPSPAAAPVAAAAPWALPGQGELRRFFLGLRGGAGLDGYAFEESPAYAGGASAGIGMEGGLTAELRLFRFFGVQAEANIVYETFNAPWIVAGETGARSIDTFACLSFVFPLLAKVPFRFENLTLAPYAGAYVLIAPWGAEKKSGASGAGEAEYRIDPLFGIVAGADAGFRVGRGEVVAELRYGVSLGTAELGGDAGPRFLRGQAVIGVGYRFGVK